MAGGDAAKAHSNQVISGLKGWFKSMQAANADRVKRGTLTSKNDGLKKKAKKRYVKGRNMAAKTIASRKPTASAIPAKKRKVKVYDRVEKGKPSDGKVEAARKAELAAKKPAAKVAKKAPPSPVRKPRRPAKRPGQSKKRFEFRKEINKYLS